MTNLVTDCLGVNKLVGLVVKIASWVAAAILRHVELSDDDLAFIPTRWAGRLMDLKLLLPSARPRGRAVAWPVSGFHSEASGTCQFGARTSLGLEDQSWPAVTRSTGGGRSLVRRATLCPRGRADARL
jgi:hypothetical protein